MPVKKVVFFSYSPVITALEQLRVLGPLSQTKIQVVNGIEGDRPNLDLIRTSDLVVFQRNFSSRYLAYKSVIEEAHKHQIPVIMDLDDNLIGLPQDHPDRKWSPFAFELPALLHAMMSVDAITVTTPTLQDVIGRYNKNVYVLPNFLDDSIWDFQETPIKDDKQSPVEIMFIGTLTHQPDLQKIAEPLRAIAEKYNGRIAFTFYGPEAPDPLKNFGNVRHIAPVTYDYADFATTTRTISADIAIAPLNDNSFNRCKSPIKYMEYAAIGLPCVYSNITPYSEVIKDGINGFLADKPDEWVEKLSRLIDDEHLRNRMLANAQVDVRSNWMLQDHAFLWQNMYDKIQNMGVVEEPENRTELAALGQIAEQIEEQLQRQAEKTANLNQAVQEAQAQNITLRESSLRELTRAAELILAEKIHSENLAKEKELLREESNRKSFQIEEFASQNLELESRLKEVEMQNDVLSLHLENTKREIANCLLSDSWRITRPLRKLSKFVRRGK